MTEKHIKRIHLLYGIVLSVALAVAAVCLIVACVGVYRTGDKPYFSREEVAAAFAPIAVPVYAALALTVGGAFLHLFLPAQPVRLRAPSRPEVALARLHRRAELDEAEQTACEKEQILRQAMRVAIGGGCAVCTVIFLLYALNPAAFTDDATASVLQALRVMLPLLVAVFVCGVLAHFAARSSIKRESEIVLRAQVRRAAEAKEATGDGVAEVHKNTADETMPLRKKGIPDPVVTAVRLALLAAGLFLLIYGFATGGIADVLTKAVNICTECIGLG